MQNINLKDCIEKILETTEEETTAIPTILSMPKANVNEFTDEVNLAETARLVTYITEAQIHQLLKQRAVIMTSKKK